MSSAPRMPRAKALVALLPAASALVAVALFVVPSLTGCRKDPKRTESPPPPHPAGVTEAAGDLAAPAQPAQPPPAPALEPAAPESGSEARPAEKAPAAEAEPKLSETPIPRPSRPPESVCMRACNKAQQCQGGTGAVADCVAGCLEDLPAAGGEAAARARVFRARDRCADVACAGLETCLGKALLGEEALAASPAIAPAAAKPRCDRLCDKEKECDPDGFALRPGGRDGCVATCVQVLINPEPVMAVRRALMARTLECVEKPCADLGECVRAAAAPEPEKASGEPHEP